MKVKRFLPLITACVFSVIGLLAFLFTDPVLSGAGDLNIADFLLSEKKIGSGFYYISPLLCDILRPLNRIVYLNWWSVFSVFLYASCLFVTLWFVNKLLAKIDLTVRIVVSSLITLFFWELILKQDVNFAQTSASAAVAGLLLSLDAVRDTSVKWKCYTEGALGFLYLLFAALVRGGINLLLLPFAFMIVCYHMVFPLPTERVFHSLAASAWKKKHYLIPCVLIVIAILFGNVSDRLYGKRDLAYKGWKATNAAATAVCDYAELYPAYADKPEAYDQFGIRESWLNMIYDFCYSDRNTFSVDSLSIMKAYKGESHVGIMDFLEILKGNLLLWIVILALFLIMGYLYGKKNVVLPFMGSLFGFMICTLYCMNRGRIAWRATCGYLLFSVLAFLIMPAMSDDPAEDAPMREGAKISLDTRIRWTALLALILMIGYLFIRDEKGHFIAPVARVTNESQANTLTYIDAHDDTLYLYHDLIRFGGAYNLWKGHAPDYLDNYIPITGCFVYGCEEELLRRGIGDLYIDMLTKPKIFVEYTSQAVFHTFYRYLCDFYDPCTAITMTENLSGNRYFRFSMRVEPETEQEITSVNSVTIEDGYGDSSGVAGAYLIECRLNPEDVNSYQDWWINVTDRTTGVRYSYGMTTEENKVLGEILRMENTWDPMNAQVYLIGKDAAGKYVKLDSLSELFLEEASKEQETE